MAEAFKQSTLVKELWISRCEMIDNGAASLASALRVNVQLSQDVMYVQVVEVKEHLQKLDSTIAQLLASNSEFVKLAISSQFSSAAAFR